MVKEKNESKLTKRQRDILDYIKIKNILLLLERYQLILV